MFSFNSYNPLQPVRYPIYGGKVSIGHTVERTSVLYSINRKVLTQFALLALDDRGLLCGHRVAKSEFADVTDPGPEKTFTYQVYGEDLNGRYGNRVMFANEEEVNTLVNFLIKQVGDERMHIFKRSIGNHEPDDVERIGREWYRRWGAGESWPLAK